MTQIPNFGPALPEIILAVGAMALLMVAAFRGDQSFRLACYGAAALLVVAAIAVLGLPAGRSTTFGGAFIVDGYAKFFKVMVFLASAVALVMSVGFMERSRVARAELPVLVVLATTGMGMMVSANDLIALYMGFELQSLALYVVAAIDRDNPRSTEAGLKYFVLGALSSGMMLYGASLVYGFTGTTSFEGIASAVAQGSRPSLGLIFGLVFLVAGLAFKVSAVPFHMWTPDVYEGAPTPVTAFFATAPKVAAMALFTRVMVDAFPNATGAWQQVVVFIAIASMLLGSFAAIGQSNLKRLLAYSSIANMGFALVGLSAGTEAGVRGVVVFMAIYLAMTLGTFAIILSMRTKDGMVEDMSDLAGLAKTQPLTAFVLSMMMFSMIGVPPLAGFFAKYVVFLAAIEAQLYALAVIGMIASAIGAYYYLRLVKLMYFDEPATRFEPMPRELAAVMIASALFIVLFALYPGPLYNAAEAAAKSLF
jgi:NADH-quinone oxidoreductase subunit N